MTFAAKPDLKLINALVRAQHWRDLLESGDAATIADLAARENCTEGLIRHRLKPAFLAPDLVKAVLLGRQGLNLSLERLKSLNIPLDWREQRALFWRAVEN